jgi:hypothetical protein
MRRSTFGATWQSGQKKMKDEEEGDMKIKKYIKKKTEKSQINERVHRD